jgi:hypothetical protein
MVSSLRPIPTPVRCAPDQGDWLRFRPLQLGESHGGFLGRHFANVLHRQRPIQLKWQNRVGTCTSPSSSVRAQTNASTRSGE